MGEDRFMSLGEKLESLQPFFDIISDKLVILDAGGSILFGNLAFAQYLGLEQQHLGHLTCQDWFPEWSEVKDDLQNEKFNSRIVHISIPNKDQKQSLRLGYTFDWDNKWLLVFSDPWESSKNAKNISELLLNNLDNPLLFIDPDYRIRAFNQAANLLYLSLHQEPIHSGDSLLELITEPEKINIFLPHIKTGFSGKSSSFAIHHDENTESSFTLEYKVKPVRDLREEIVGVLILGQDITRKNKTENLLEKNGDLFISTFHEIHDPALLWKKTPGGKIILEHFNPASENLSNGEIKRWLGATIEEFFDGQAEIIHRFYNCFETGISQRIETQHILKTTGIEKWFLADYIKISDDFLLNITIDITDRKEIELTLQENQRHLSTLLESLPGMAYRCKNDPDWTMEFVSAGVEELIGYADQDLIGNRKISYAQLIHPDDRQKVWDHIQEALESKQNFEITYRIQLKNSIEKWVWEKGQGIFDEKDELIALEGFISDITERIYSEQAAEKAMIQAQALKQALDELASQLDLSQVLKRILVSLKTVLNYDSATLFLRDQDKFKVVAARGFEHTARLINKTFPATDLLLREIQMVKATIILDDAQNDPRFEKWEGSDLVRGWMGVPLIRHEEFIGLLTIDKYNPCAYTQEDARLALSFANSAAIVIENARLFEQTQLMALTDTLTGIYNRRYFYELAQKEFSRSKRYQNPMSIILIDIDHFKNVNDHYGHLAGDQVLMQFVQRIQEELRTSDILARFGGEEFIILLPETNLGDATQVAERLREVTAQYPFLLVTAQTFITISLGVSCFKFTTLSLDHLIDESDKALYEAKQFGRNRVRAWQQK
jgi:diguanylate cyclase (GGDEF)-like protein/PAS domain S-box-containing protein